MTDDDRLAAYLDDPDAVDDPSPHVRAVRDHLRSASVWEEPPDDLVDRIAADIDRERLSRPDPAPAGPADRSRERRVDRRPLWLAAGAAAVAAVIALVVLLPTDDATRIQLQPTPLAQSASATASVRSTPAGEAITLDVSGLPPAPEGFFYQGWVRGDRGLVSIGTFHLRGGGDTEVELWSGVPLEQYPVVSVTLEPEDGDQTSSGQAVLIGELDA